MSAEHAVDLWLDRAQVTMLNQEQIALLVETVDRYGERCERLANETRDREIARRVCAAIDKAHAAATEEVCAACGGSPLHRTWLAPDGPACIETVPRGHS